jgi:hypothetical protein
MVCVAAVPTDGYSFAGWSGTESGTENPKVLKVVENEWIIPVFAKIIPDPVIVPDTWTIRVDESAYGECSIDPQKNAYLSDELVKISASASPGYHFASWGGTKVSSDNPLVFPASGNEWLVPVFEPDERPPEPVTWSVRTLSQPGGTVTISPKKTTVEENEIICITATPASGYAFTGWSGTENGTDNPKVLKVVEDEMIVPIFTKIIPDPVVVPVTWSLRVDESVNGECAIDPKRDAYGDGEYAKVTATPRPGYLFTGWSGTITGAQNPLVVRMTSNAWLIPQFKEEETYQVVTDRNPLGGSVVINPDRTSGYRFGDQCTLTAVAKEGYRFDGWSGDFTGTQKSVFITFGRDYQTQASFSVIPVETTYSLTLGTPANGSVTAEPAKAAYYENEVVRVTASPASGYMLNAWSGGSYGGRELSFDVVMDGNKSASASFMKRQWTHLVYMAADNNLDTQSINDINEMESGATNGKAMSILVLVDRQAGNGDWSDTRLYEIRQDPNGNSAILVSRRLDSGELGLSANIAGELDMSDPVNIGRFVDYAKRAYAADRYSFSVWGHGTGWRGSSDFAFEQPATVKAIAVDETSGRYMPIARLSPALRGKSMAVIGFDTCFAATLEVLYELRDCAQWFVGSPGLVPSSGWAYGTLFSAFNPASVDSGAFCDNVISQFRDQYGSVPGASISKINLSKITSLAQSFDAFAFALSSAITTQQSRNAILDSMIHDVALYHAASYPTDCYLDVKSFADTMIASRSGFPNAASVLSSGNALLSSIGTAVGSTWSQSGGTVRCGIGVNFIALVASDTPDSSHDSGYVRGSGNIEQSSFVTNSAHWVPNVIPSSESFLDKLLYWPF